jgi:hypothetical protein
LNRLGELVRQAAAGVSPTGPSIANAEQLRRYVEQKQAATPALHEEPPSYGEDSGKPNSQCAPLRVIINIHFGHIFSPSLMASASVNGARHHAVTA